MLPIADADAIADPAIAPISIAEIILINANPPGSAPTIVLANRIKRSAIPPCVINCPERIKNGMASNAKLSSAVAILCAMVVTAGNKGIDTMMVNNEEIAMLHATGVPIQIKNIKLKTSIMTGKNSMTYFELFVVS
jgi:hypothetical protein